MTNINAFNVGKLSDDQLLNELIIYDRPRNGFEIIIKELLSEEMEERTI